MQGYGGPAYEVMFLLDADDDAVPPLRLELASLGDSLVVVGGEGLWNLHVHVDDAGAAVEAAMRAGRPYRIRITYLEQAEQLRTTGRGELAVRALVMVAHGPGIAALLESNGATIVPAEPARRPSTAEILDGIVRAAAREVVVLPSDRDTLQVAEAAAAEARDLGLRAAVIPTRSVVQSLAAAAVHEPGRRFDEDVVAMTRAAGATRYGAVTVAVKRAFTSAGVCEVGDVLAVADGDIVDIGSDLGDVSRRILDRLLSTGGDLVTVVTGLDCDDDLVDDLGRWLRKAHPGVEVLVYEGGQPLWPLIVGVE
jgi:dihydroxyacetone kinase-like predicted kinase